MSVDVNYINKPTIRDSIKQRRNEVFFTTCEIFKRIISIY